MRHARGLLSVFAVLLIVSACSPASPPKATPSTGASPTAAGSSPTATVISSDGVSAVDTLLANLTSQDLFSGSVLISQHGQVLLSKGYGFADRAKKIPNGPRTRFAIASNTKRFTAAAIMLLQVQGKLKTGDLICTYIPQCPTAWGVITIKELLTHTSGIPDHINTLPDFLNYAGPPLTPLQVIAHIRDLPLEFTPGTTYKYDNSGYFLQKYIFTPLNLNDTGYNHDWSGLAIGYDDSAALSQLMEPSLGYAAGALYSTVEDMNRWDQALTTDALLPAASRAEMFAPQSAISDDGKEGYGYGVGIGTDHGLPTILHGGFVPGYISQEVRFVVDDVTVIMLINQSNVDANTVYGYISAKLFNTEMDQ